MATNKGASGESEVRRRQRNQRIQNFVVLWLDASIDESTPEFKESLAQLCQSVGTTIEIFKDANDCIQEIQETINQQVLVVVPGCVEQNIIPKIHALPQVESIYVLCNKKYVDEKYSNKMSKVKAVCTDIKSICEGLEHDCHRCDQNLIPMSFQNTDPLFMYTQLVKEAILQIEYDDTKAIKELAEFFRQKGNIMTNEIKDFEKTYTKEKAVWWYTTETFVHKTLNYALRVFDVDILMKMGFYMSHLHRQMQQLSDEQHTSPKGLQIMGKEQFKLFRGQRFSNENFEKLKQSRGQLMSFNNFLSTSYDQEVSLRFAKESSSQDTVGILFIMHIDADLCKKSKIPFVEITGDLGYFKDDEAEVLFTTHTLFRIEKIQEITDPSIDRLYKVNLTVASPDTYELKQVADSLDKEIGYRRGFARLAVVFLKSGLSEQARQVYQALLEKATTDKDIAEYNYQLGWVYSNLGEYEKAIQYYEGYYKIKRKTLSVDHKDLVEYYNNIGSVYDGIGDYSKALSSYQQSLEIKKQVLLPNHPSLAASYNNIGLVYYNMGEYAKALSSHQQSLEIKKQVLPPNHPDLAASYNNIGMVYDNMGEYSKALEYYEKDLEITKKALPSNHPDLAASYNNMGLMYDNMGEYANALKFYNLALGILEKSLPLTHANFGHVYSGLGSVYDNMDDYSKALTNFENAVKIREKALPLTHVDLAASYNDLGTTYAKMKMFSEASCLLEKALNIRREALSTTHPDLATSYWSLGLMYNRMGEYEKALLYHEQALDIRMKVLSANHSFVGKSYNEMGLVYINMSNYTKALSCYEQALRIWQNSLPATHSYIVSVKKDIENVKQKIF